MTRLEIAQKLTELASQRFKKDPSELRPNGDFFEQLGIDSFRAMELLSDLEHEFDVEIPDYELQGVTTFDDLAALIERRLA